MEDSPYLHVKKGSFLIASPEIDSGFYFRSVIILCEHSPSGSFGLIINKRIDIELPLEILNLEEKRNPNVEMRVGGPVQPGQMMLLHSSSKIPKQTLELCEGVYLGGDLEFLQEAIQDPEGPPIRLCFGYAGWGPGRLDQEILEGGWFVHEGSPEYLFNLPENKVWQTILRNMGGKYATFSMIPEDLRLN